MPPIAAAHQLRDALGFGLDRRVGPKTWSEALSGLAEHTEHAGVLVMISGVVDSNTHRQLNSEEFRGFALADEFAPVVFINGADFNAAQIFTLAHELAHIALGGSAISRPDLKQLDDDNRTERWCNEVAAGLSVPQDSVREAYRRGQDLTSELDRLAQFYEASTLVVLRRIADAGLVSRGDHRVAYDIELDRVRRIAEAGRHRVETSTTLRPSAPASVSRAR